MKRWDRIRHSITDVLCYIAGCLLYAVSVDCFSQPNRIVNGGATGVALLFNALTGAPVGLTVFLLNLPLFGLALWKLGRGFALRTVFCTTLCSVFIDGLKPVLPAFTGDTMLAALFGGLAAGAGLGLLYLRGATSGGVDVVSRLLELRFPQLSMGRLMLLLDAAVVALSVPVFGELELAMYALVMIFVGSHLIDTVLYGRDAGKLVFVATQRETAVTEQILVTLKRGVTRLQASGAYTGEKRNILMCAVSRSQLYELQRLVRDTDPAALIITAPTDEVLGEGFKIPEPKARKNTKKFSKRG